MHLQCWETQLHEGVTQQAATLLRVNSARQGVAWRAGVLHTCQQTATTKSPESTSACVSLPVYYIYLPVCIEKKTKKKTTHKSSRGLFLSWWLFADLLFAKPCLPVSGGVEPPCVQNVSADLSVYLLCLSLFFFFFLFHHWKIWSCGCVTSRYTRRRGTHWKLRRLLLSLILCLLT